jgi:prepilin-type processing-associated H-X9-DG protein
MKSRQSKGRAWAFTAPELLVTLACLALLVALLLPGLARPKARSSRLNCSNCLKQISLAFRCWALDNNDRFPMQVPTAEGGTKEIAASGLVFPHFAVMSNELSTPKILLCPADTKRTYATNFGPAFADMNISYFVNIDAVAAQSNVLSGDRNLTTKALPGSPLVYVTKDTRLGWTREIHSEKGNLAFGDGSVHQFTNFRAREVPLTAEGVTNRLALP